MKVFLKLSIVSFFILSIAIGVLAGDNESQLLPEDCIANSLDSLLLATEHVYVKADHNVQGVFLENIGAVFMGNISMTSIGHFRKHLPSHFTGIGDDEKSKLSKEDLEEIRDTMEELEIDLEEISNEMDSLSQEIDAYVIRIEKDLESPEEIAVELPDLSALKNLKKLNKLKVLKKLSPDTFQVFDYSDLNVEAEKRLSAMDYHASMFKKEVVNLLMNHWENFHSLKSSDSIIVIFRVSEPEFAEQFGSNKFIVRVKNAKLQKAGAKQNSDIENFMKDVNSNI